MGRSENIPGWRVVASSRRNLSTKSYKMDKNIVASPGLNAFWSRAASDRSGFLDTPSVDSKSEFAYTGGILERTVFITPAFISIFMISFVTFWGARLSPALTVLFICCYISYGWVKGLHSAFFFSLRRYPSLSRIQECQLE